MTTTPRPSTCWARSKSGSSSARGSDGFADLNAEPERGARVPGRPPVAVRAALARPELRAAGGGTLALRGGGTGGGVAGPGGGARLPRGRERPEEAAGDPHPGRPHELPARAAGARPGALGAGGRGEQERGGGGRR